MEHREIIAKNAPQPLGPYSQAVRAGTFIFVSGQIGINPRTGALEQDIEKQARQAIKNLLAILETAGAKATDVVRADLFLSDMKNFEIVNNIYAGCFSSNPKPTRQVCGVRELPKNALVEISCIALTNQ
jgi:2-iminobutanoate/2-iminopropanoate deaminase